MSVENTPNVKENVTIQNKNSNFSFSGDFKNMRTGADNSETFQLFKQRVEGN